MAVNILIVDDSITHVKMLTMVLENEDQRVIVSYNGLDIFKILEKEKIDVILLDVILPDIDGFQVLERLQQDEELSEIPVIMVTGLTKASHVKRALDLGALDYIRKPSEPIEVIARVNSALRLRAKQKLLEAYAARDGLTKLYNRSHTEKLLRKLIRDKKGIEKGISFAMLDCDFFKRINDTYGHTSGDMVLVSVANAINKSIKSSDIAGRYGGEEFCVILVNSSLAEGVIVSERIRNNIQRIKYNFNQDEVMVTISVGLSHMDQDQDKNFLELVNEADTALYAAKSRGRNRVEFYEKSIQKF